MIYIFRNFLKVNKIRYM